MPSIACPRDRPSDSVGFSAARALLQQRQLVNDLVEEAAADRGEPGKHAKRLARFAGAKRTFAVRMANYLGDREPRRAVKCATCANILHFRHWLDENEGRGRLSLAGGYFCGQWKLCLTCAIKRGSKGLGELLPVMVDQLQRDPQLRAYLVTLTVKDAADMSEAAGRERFEHLRASLRRYLERRNDTIKKRRAGLRLRGVEANKAVGIHWSIEMGRGKGSGGWHPHVHAAWIGHHRPNPIALSEEWLAITGDSRVVDVTEFECTRRGGARTSEAIARDVAEVCKYALKPHELTPADAYAAHVATQGKHFVGRVGTLRLSALERERIDREYSPEMRGRFVDLFYRYVERTGRYQEDDRGGVASALVREGAREVNRQLAPLDRASVVERFASRGARGASPELDTRTILGDTGTPADPGPPSIPSRGSRYAAPIDPGEDLFAAG